VVPLTPCGQPLLGCLLAWNFGPCPLFLFLSLSWVLSFHKVWQGFIINKLATTNTRKTIKCHVWSGSQEVGICAKPAPFRIIGPLVSLEVL